MDITINLDCNDADRMEAFWTAALGYRRAGTAAHYRGFVPESGTGPKFILQQVAEGKAAKNRMHLDLDHPADFDIDAEADRLVRLGATRVTRVDDEIDGTAWIVMQDPEGNEFCVCAG